MKTISRIATVMVFAASAAFANDHLNQIATHARSLETEFRQLSVVLKSKNFDSGLVQSRLAAADLDIEKLKGLSAEFEQSHPQLGASGQSEWRQTKDLIHLIDLFHGAKSDLMNQNPYKNRSMLKAHADGLAQRAAGLQKVADRLAKTLSSSGS